ncbi:uncharacterized protein FIBRA_06308 [Fibroporia radiculosa]|uniref:SHSP domain-containing protein n=1 Tax=Fibroporia radiculosa TaxID=599839 RepID=J4IB70_9APHY|nr:uncharacterized protein FIBRA_06308 [Fibroporia radiculosa]CCM04146.1 predicted protein [Fibroporia radiculosa]
MSFLLMQPSTYKAGPLWHPPQQNTLSSDTLGDIVLVTNASSLSAFNMSPSNFYQPFYSLADFNRMFDEAFSARTSGVNNTDGRVQRSDNSARFLQPRMNLHENKEENVVTATFEMPGLNKENVQISVHNGILTVSGESKVSTARDEHGYAVRERRHGKFSRAVPLPQGINSDDIRASMENGVLTVTFPKTTPETAPKKIAIA